MPPFSTITVDEREADFITSVEEGQFSDVKSIDIAPSKLAKSLSAFANSDGGELYIGIDELSPKKTRSWRGFRDVESANGHIQAFETLFPLGENVEYEFLSCNNRPGYVLHVQVNKSKGIVESTNSLPYVRRGAQNLPIDTPEKKQQLEYCKGLTSFESKTVDVPLELITESEPVVYFIEQVVPKSTPQRWLRKQVLIVNDMPTVAGILLFAEEPQAALPKRCGIKVYRYKTSEKEGFRDAMAFDPMTIEGCLYHQIMEAVQTTTKQVERIPKMGEDSLEAITYPPEALHEIITNAVLHRDYSIADDVHIRIFDNRIEVESPGRLPAHITTKNILDERFARNGSVVRILNKFPDPPNKDVGEGLNTAFSAMHQLGLKEPLIDERENSVLVILRHEPLASPEEAIMDYLESSPTINNSEARKVTHISEDHRIRSIFRRMEAKGMIERTPESKTSNTRYKKAAKMNGD
ncbi:MAG: ATP-dependent DNA helicase RecG [Planctomycetota bacterium]|nr:MAG: ATP-dependent DNA helicase RecG [Planctomycetota bacterium]REK26805.1 MAG: ATP-dependent DNA helicase RecG [Planctomycetota bacterium]